MPDSYDEDISREPGDGELLFEPGECEFRIEYTIQRRRPADEDFVEIGFGSSGGWGRLGAAAYEVESQIANQCWETSEGMPDPDTIEPPAGETNG